MATLMEKDVLLELSTGAMAKISSCEATNDSDLFKRIKLENPVKNGMKKC